MKNITDTKPYIAFSVVIALIAVAIALIYIIPKSFIEELIQ
jgi:hypothetical protein